MYDQFLTVVARERTEEVEREAEAFRLLIDNAPLRFRNYTIVTDGRRALARGLVRLAEAIEPAGRACSEC